MAALQAHHMNARKVALSVYQLLEQLESGSDTSISLQSEISQQLNKLAHEVQTLKDLLPTVDASQRANWRKKISQLQDESSSLQGSLGKFAGRAAAQQKEKDDRQELFRRRTAGPSDCTIDIEAISKEHKNLNDAHSNLDALLQHAGEVHGAVGRQGQALRGIQRRTLNLLSTLGMSNDVLRSIERQLMGDKLLLVVGMLLTLGLIWCTAS